MIILVLILTELCSLQEADVLTTKKTLKNESPFWWSWGEYQNIICELSRSKLLRELLIICTLRSPSADADGCVSFNFKPKKKLNARLSTFFGGAGGNRTPVRELTSYPSTGLDCLIVFVDKALKQTKRDSH